MSSYVMIALGVILGTLLWSWTVLVRESWPRRRRRCAACGHMMYLLQQADHPLTCPACGGDYRIVGLVSDGLWRLVRPHPVVRVLVMWTGVVFLSGVVVERLVLEPLAVRVVEQRQSCAMGRRGGPLIEVAWVARGWGWPWEMRETRDRERYVEVVVRNALRLSPDREAVRVRLEPDTWRYVRLDKAEQGTLSAEVMLKWMAEGWRGLHVAEEADCAAEACAVIRTGDIEALTTMRYGSLDTGPVTELRPLWPWGWERWWWVVGGVWVLGGAALLLRGRERHVKEFWGVARRLLPSRGDG